MTDISLGMFQPASIGRIVHVTLNGRESAAIVTAVWDRTMINATVFLFDGTTTAVSSIHHAEHPDGGSITWHWPERVDAMPAVDLGFKAL